MTVQQNLAMIPEGWHKIYRNTLEGPAQVEGFRMEGDGAVSFPQGRLRLESTRSAEEGQKANVVFWCPEIFPAEVAVSWRFRPLREPGLAILFFAAAGAGGKDLFDPSLPVRTGEYDQYHHGEMDAYHISYFRRMWEEERAFHTCNLRKSYGFHLVAQGADPLPDTSDMTEAYRMLMVKRGTAVTFTINELPVLHWVDDGSSFGPLLGAGRLGFRQMAPLIAEYSDLIVYAP
ncbi:hypothetical protein C173_03959 [Paenibacillus sp. FSL R7-277]|uniref:DUF1961 family protein n=1 Tax=Paenibacillus sp. FSL R7-277 TaxID=1227352 RepID=UPI0003E22822|nr:DUF1961 family protein [Paenibacillus sp. FSL R7-277]ETT77641.1 hypothetical protein C173_03959 [Paenibacillus sp. FSL R7-277]